MAAIAAESVTSAPGAIGAGRGASSPGDISDLFAEILDDITQDLSSGVATSPVAPTDIAAPLTDPATKPAASDAPLLQSALADLQAHLAPATASDGDVKKSDKPGDAKPATQDSNTDDPGLALILAAQQPALAASSQLTAPASCDPPAQDTATSDLSSDPLRGAEDAPPPAKPARTQTGIDPALFAGTEAVTPTATVAAAAALTGDRLDNETTPVQPPTVSAATALAAGIDATDMAAAPMVASGSIQKPAKPASPSGDSEKSELQGSTAAALAAVSAAATRTFADQPTGSALPLRSNVGDSKNDAATPSAPTLHAATTDPAPAAATSAATPAPAALPPVPSHAAPQTDVANTAAATPLTAAPTAPHAAQPISAQLQVLQSDPQDATPNLAALAVTIAAKSADGAKHFDIRLDPPELGRVDVRLSVDDTGRAQATLAVEKPQTLALLQKDSPQLERALKDAGLDLSQSGLNFSLKGQQQQSGSNAPAGRQRHHTVRAIVAADTASTLSTAAVPSSDARLDIRV